MPGYRLTATEDTSVRVFNDGMPEVIYDFPATMNGCDQARFVVRWRTLDANAVARFTPAYGGTPDLGIVPIEGARSKTGSKGKWVSDSQCEQPSWTFVSASGKSTLADITVEYEVWTAAP